jgi:hypothetical protein
VAETNRKGGIHDKAATVALGGDVPAATGVLVVGGGGAGSCSTEVGRRR